MNPIYKLFSGQYVDLDKVLAVNPVAIIGSHGEYATFSVISQLQEKPIVIGDFDFNSQIGLHQPPGLRQHGDDAWRWKELQRNIAKEAMEAHRQDFIKAWETWKDSKWE